jgi:hypothetical protein
LSVAICWPLGFQLNTFGTDLSEYVFLEEDLFYFIIY